LLAGVSLLPNIREKRATRQQLAAVLNYVLQEVVFAEQQSDRAFNTPGSVINKIELKRPDPQDRFARFCGRSRASILSRQRIMVCGSKLSSPLPANGGPY
jgi:hypothetical protein